MCTRSGDLLWDAELGQVALIAKSGRPAILAVPFDRQLLELGVHCLSGSLACYWLPGGPGVSPRSVRCSEHCRNSITGSRMRRCMMFCA